MSRTCRRKEGSALALDVLDKVRMELKEQCKALVGEKMGQHSAPARDTALGQVRFKGTV